MSFLWWGHFLGPSHQDGWVVKLLHSRCNGHKLLWVQILHLVITLNSVGYNKRTKYNQSSLNVLFCREELIFMTLLLCAKSLWKKPLIKFLFQRWFIFDCPVVLLSECCFIYSVGWHGFLPSAQSNWLKTNINKCRCPLCYLGRHFQQPRMINRLWFLPFSSQQSTCWRFFSCHFSEPESSEWPWRLLLPSIPWLFASTGNGWTPVVCDVNSGQNWTELDPSVDSVPVLLSGWRVKSFRCKAAFFVPLLSGLQTDALIQMQHSGIRQEKMYRCCVFNFVWLKTLFRKVQREPGSVPVSSRICAWTE